MHCTTLLSIEFCYCIFTVTIVATGGQLWCAMCLSGNPPNFVFLLSAYSSVVAMWKINFLSLVTGYTALNRFWVIWPKLGFITTRYWAGFVTSLSSRYRYHTSINHTPPPLYAQPVDVITRPERTVAIKTSIYLNNTTHQHYNAPETKNSTTRWQFGPTKCYSHCRRQNNDSSSKYVT